ncbi:hypothetical protein Tco_1094670 [Tanacetum coccineum]|uniref:HNH homing endonuclease n=1 Tax=Tanacetum coccineum TaxID=301880 RepID=A0ABQ5IGA9_9ASTR
MKNIVLYDEVQNSWNKKFGNHKMVEFQIIDGSTARFHGLAKLVATHSLPLRANVSIATFRDGLFKKKENAGNKRRSNDQNRNQGREDRNKRQRTGGNFALTILEQVKDNVRPRERNIDEYWWRIYKSGDLEVLES